ELTLGAARPLPDGLVLHYSVSCYECDGGWDPHRAYVDGDGTLIREWLREPIIAASGVDGYLHSLASSPGGGTWYATVCHSGFCIGISEAEEGAGAQLVRSTDGGVTWSVAGEFPPDV